MGKERREGEELSDIDVVAYDEAGHVIVAYVLKHQVAGVVFERNPKGTFNGRTDHYRDGTPPDDLKRPYIDPHVPYDQGAILPLDEVVICGAISAAGKAGVILLYRQKGISEHLVMMGMQDARSIIQSLREKKIPLHERKSGFRGYENLALQIVSWPICKEALEQIAGLFRERMLSAQRDKQDSFIVAGRTLMEMVWTRFSKVHVSTKPNLEHL